MKKQCWTFSSTLLRKHWVHSVQSAAAPEKLASPGWLRTDVSWTKWVLSLLHDNYMGRIKQFSVNRFIDLLKMFCPPTIVSSCDMSTTKAYCHTVTPTQFAMTDSIYNFKSYKQPMHCVLISWGEGGGGVPPSCPWVCQSCTITGNNHHADHKHGSGQGCLFLP